MKSNYSENIQNSELYIAGQTMKDIIVNSLIDFPPHSYVISVVNDVTVFFVLLGSHHSIK